MRGEKFFLEQEVVAQGRQQWASLDELWVYVRPLRGWTSLRAGAVEFLATHRAEMRFHKAVRPGMRLRSDALLLSIFTVEDIDGRKRRLRCLCEERSLTPPQSLEAETLLETEPVSGQESEQTSAPTPSEDDE